MEADDWGRSIGKTSNFSEPRSGFSLSVLSGGTFQPASSTASGLPLHFRLVHFQSAQISVQRESRLHKDLRTSEQRPAQQRRR